MDLEYIPKNNCFCDKKIKSIKERLFDLKEKNQLFNQMFDLYSYYDSYKRNKNKYEYCIELRNRIDKLVSENKRLNELFVINFFVSGKCDELAKREKVLRHELEQMVRKICYDCNELFQLFKKYSGKIKKFKLELKNSSLEDLKLILNLFDIDYNESIYPLLKNDMYIELTNKLKDYDINKLKEILNLLHLTVEAPDTLYFDEKKAIIDLIKNNIHKLTDEELDITLNILNIKKEDLSIYLKVKDIMIEKINNSLSDLYNLDNISQERINYNKYNLKDVFCYKLITTQNGVLYPKFYLQHAQDKQKCYDMNDFIYGNINSYVFKISFKSLKYKKIQIETLLNTINKKLNELSYYRFILEEYSELTHKTLLYGQYVLTPNEASMNNFERWKVTNRKAFDLKLKLVTIYYLIKEYKLETLFSDNEVFKMLEECEEQYNKENDLKIKVKSK